MAGRRRSRQVALQVLYAFDLGDRKGQGRQADVEAVFETFADHFELPEGARAFAKELVAGVVAHRDELDLRIAASARNWRLERMAAVDRNVLRLAAYELVHLGTPVQVAIDEAVELARQFGGDPSPGFVNGVLDAVAASLAEVAS
ncbi:MAG: transcription antitermination factor NusB [bacterium]|nr:transcription antitermination factor NusB [bacterium]MCP5071214.1 transcription antitermination factor NusB [bacterium]